MYAGESQRGLFACQEMPEHFILNERLPRDSRGN